MRLERIEEQDRQHKVLSEYEVCVPPPLWRLCGTVLCSDRRADQAVDKLNRRPGRTRVTGTSHSTCRSTVHCGLHVPNGSHLSAEGLGL